MSLLQEDKDGVCTKYGTVDDNNEIPYEEAQYLCKSGLAHMKIDEKTSSSKYICDSIEEEPECDENGLKKAG